MKLKSLVFCATIATAITSHAFDSEDSNTYSTDKKTYSKITESYDDSGREIKIQKIRKFGKLNNSGGCNVQLNGQPCQYMPIYPIYVNGGMGNFGNRNLNQNGQQNGQQNNGQNSNLPNNANNMNNMNGMNGANGTNGGAQQNQPAPSGYIGFDSDGNPVYIQQGQQGSPINQQPGSMMGQDGIMTPQLTLPPDYSNMDN